jgi:hypothetical protein
MFFECEPFMELLVFLEIDFHREPLPLEIVGATPRGCP